MGLWKFQKVLYLHADAKQPPSCSQNTRPRTPRCLTQWQEKSSRQRQEQFFLSQGSWVPAQGRKPLSPAVLTLFLSLCFFFSFSLCQLSFLFLFFIIPYLPVNQRQHALKCWNPSKSLGPGIGALSRKVQCLVPQVSGQPDTKTTWNSHKCQKCMAVKRSPCLKFSIIKKFCNIHSPVIIRKKWDL